MEIDSLLSVALSLSYQSPLLLKDIPLWIFVPLITVLLLIVALIRKSLFALSNKISLSRMILLDKFIEWGRHGLSKLERNLRLVEAKRGYLSVDMIENEKKQLKAIYQKCEAVMSQDRMFLDDLCSIDDLAKAVLSNRTYVSRAINLHSNKGFTAFRNEMRARYAEGMIRSDPNCSLKEVASVSGFSNYTSFFRIFKIYTGYSPTQFMKRLNYERLQLEKEPIEKEALENEGADTTVQTSEDLSMNLEQELPDLSQSSLSDEQM